MSPYAPISRLHGLALTGLISSSYVFSVYLSLLVARPRPPLWRNDPVVIRARSISATASTLLSCVLVYVTVRATTLSGRYSPAASHAMHTTLQHLGLPSGSLSGEGGGSIKAYFVVPALFLGPLYATFLSKALPFQQNWDLRRNVISQFTTWEGFRNYIMAPITEEVTYRACVLSVYKLSGYSRSAMIWTAPCWFSIAHIHHGLETYRRLGRTPGALKTALMGVAFQFAYTSVFGWLSGFLFLRTSSIMVPIVAHIFCNIMGFPAIAWELQQFPSHKISIILAYVMGITLFCYSIYPWTFNPNSIYWKNETAQL